MPWWRVRSCRRLLPLLDPLVLLGLSVLVLGGVSGEHDEHVVEGRAPHRDVRDADPGAVEPAHRLGDATPLAASAS